MIVIAPGVVTVPSHRDTTWLGLVLVSTWSVCRRCQVTPAVVTPVTVTSASMAMDKTMASPAAFEVKASDALPLPDPETRLPTAE